MNLTCIYDLDDLVESQEQQLKDYLVEQDIHLLNDQINWVFMPADCVNKNGMSIFYKGVGRPICDLEFNEIPKFIKCEFSILNGEGDQLDNFIGNGKQLVDKIVELSFRVDLINSQDTLDEALSCYQQICKAKVNVFENKIDVSFVITFKKVKR